MTLVEKAVSGGAVPPWNKPASTASRLDNSPKASEADLLRVSSFNTEHISARNAGRASQCRLGMSRALPDQPQELRKPFVVRVHPVAVSTLPLISHLSQLDKRRDG